MEPRATARSDPRTHRTQRKISFTGDSHAWPAGIAFEDFPGDTRLDQDRLSEANRTSFRIDYDQHGKVVSSLIEAAGCECIDCRSNAPIVPLEKLKKSGMLDVEDGFVSTTPTLDELAAKPGEQGQIDSLRNQVGGQVWLNYSDTWRVIDAPG